MKSCDLCPRRCGCDRSAGHCGVCRNTDAPRIYQHFLHFGEEITIVPAFIINMAGCNLHCPTCPERCRFEQKPLAVGTPEHYARAMAGYFRRTQMPKSIEWIGGEPSTQILFVLETSWVLKSILSPCPPIYLNTNAYFDAELLDMMAGAIDSFVFDLKCVDACAPNIVMADDYWQQATTVIRKAAEIFENPGIIRHLVMPGHVECCTKPILDWCRLYVPEMTFNLMTTFQDFRSKHSGPDHLPDSDKSLAIRMLEESGLRHCMIDGK